MYFYPISTYFYIFREQSEHISTYFYSYQYISRTQWAYFNYISEFLSTTSLRPDGLTYRRKLQSTTPGGSFGQKVGSRDMKQNGLWGRLWGRKAWFSNFARSSKFSTEAPVAIHAGDCDVSEKTVLRNCWGGVFTSIEKPPVFVNFWKIPWKNQRQYGTLRAA